MCMNRSLATFRCLKCACSSLIAVRIIADSLATTARSSAAVLQARTLRIKSLSFIDIVAVKFSCFRHATHKTGNNTRVDLYGYSDGRLNAFVVVSLLVTVKIRPYHTQKLTWIAVLVSYQARKSPENISPYIWASTMLLHSTK